MKLKEGKLKTKEKINMTKKEVLKNVKNGKFTSLEFCTYPTPLKDFKEREIKKVVKGVFRLGIAYCNLKSKIGLKTENLKYGHWEEEFKNLIIKHKDVEYLRIYTTNNHKHKRTTKWYLDGVEVTKEELIQMGAISDKKSSATELFNIRLENLIRIGNTTV